MVAIPLCPQPAVDVVVTLQTAASNDTVTVLDVNIDDGSGDNASHHDLDSQDEENNDITDLEANHGLADLLSDPDNILESCNKCMSNGKSRRASLTTPSVYKDVVVVGNGPSGIVLSYFLAGNWPYYNGCGESINEMLHYRLLAASSATKNPQNSSIVEQDLRFLAQGLEGRSTNPVALLFDILNHPDADLGLELPSLLEWQNNPKHAVEHVVLGKGPPGGAWQLMDGNVLTISLGCWMELPQMNFREWEATQEARCVRDSRASVASVAQYYCDYVLAHRLEQYFVSNSEITEVTRIPCSSAGLPTICDNLPADLQLDAAEEPTRKVRRHTISEIPVNSQNGRELRKRNRTLWHVKGYTRDPANGGRKKDFSYLTKHLVLATGSSDSPNILNVPGEHLDFVLHSLKHLEQLITSGQLNQDSDPVLIVGAGLSAADAIIAARFHSIPVIHVFRRTVDDKNLIFKQLPENMYPEYHKVYQMMQDPSSYDEYKAFEQHVIAEIRPDRRVKLMGPLSCGVVKVSHIVICIGSHPDLSFLRGIERNLGVHPGLPIDCKRNPIAIDVSTHESVREPGLFAVGPLVGENFVRFLQGGALAITNHLNQSKKLPC
ncbi:Oxidative stress-induced growth inhibitor 2 [Orchesella cincta]|uniref:Oxidative stress-induced growth inhibitor 2 n=1 Tax=Orchesella cincta TaxID=48709 RepID=A0A1D2N165_ORCCI|nr:Oxidative stress-induced growth inhibitor 2 [Orchesella cincta]